MENVAPIGKRIKELRKKNKLSQDYVAKRLYISQAAYSLIENSRNRIAISHIVNLSKLYNVTTDFILKGEKSIIKISPNNGFIPLVKDTAHAGFLKNFEENHYYDEYDWYRIPGFNPTLDQNLFEVEGECMSPTLLPNDIVVCQKQKIDKVIDGAIVLIITKNKTIIKRLRLDDNPDYLLVESDNPQEKGLHKVKKVDIKQLMVVLGKISSNLVPHHQIVSTGKIKELEESVDLLKRELFSLNKKLNTLTK
ncbi:LexA family transcriptional regulator [Salegentibacter sp. JZCK2]|uniref:XRE family transcriptional regulator n=1 Tax=Salegentibacter tibetensis TaxID=2873600 RepID=UPI001CCE1391|nr:LexA family transcriptional regulator [Salegentibacter tibetensis]MBZ9730567.1 LexA family transcriptional regulator [Salegentibacter tibetensis]